MTFNFHLMSLDKVTFSHVFSIADIAHTLDATKLTKKNSTRSNFGSKAEFQFLFIEKRQPPAFPKLSKWMQFVMSVINRPLNFCTEILPNSKHSIRARRFVSSSELSWLVSIRYATFMTIPITFASNACSRLTTMIGCDKKRS